MGTLLFPHVPKAGGRMIEATFESIGSRGAHRLGAHRFISKERRSPVHQFNLIDGHRTYEELAKNASCYKTNEVAKGCFIQGSKPGCTQRMISAFYTATGRNTQFRCRKYKKYTKAHLILQ